MINPRKIFAPAKKPGLPPGSLVYTGKEEAREPHILLMDYDKNTLREEDITNLADYLELRELPSTTWIHVQGLHDASLIGKIGEGFSIHPLCLEDIMNSGQRPKVEEWDGYLYLVMKMLRTKRVGGQLRLEEEQVSLIVSRLFLISFQEKPEDIFPMVRERIRIGKPRIREGGTDYLGYALLDLIVDNYFVILEEIGNELQEMEERALNDPARETVEEINTMRRQLAHMKRSVWPVREILNQLVRMESHKLIRPPAIVYFRDVFDHTIHVIELLENHREFVSSIMDLYLSSLSNKMNEVMKVLTIIATIFIPLTFLSGLYGMNFENMPELGFRYGYFVVLGIMALTTIGMLIYFKRKDWW
ncbi:MAG: magnesium/cobalt transporter CorA [Bacteroidia bacterium]